MMTVGLILSAYYILGSNRTREYCTVKHRSCFPVLCSLLVLLVVSISMFAFLRQGKTAIWCFIPQQAFHPLFYTVSSDAFIAVFLLVQRRTFLFVPAKQSGKQNYSGPGFSMVTTKRKKVTPSSSESKTLTEPRVGKQYLHCSKGWPHSSWLRRGEQRVDHFGSGVASFLEHRLQFEPNRLHSIIPLR